MSKIGFNRSGPGKAGKDGARGNALRTEAERRRRLFIVRMWVSVTAVAIVLAAAARTEFEPATDVNGSVRVQIPKGSGTSAIGEALEKKGVIRSGLAFFIYARLHGARGLKAGNYILSPDLTLGQILHILEQGPAVIRVTIPEGYTAAQIAATLDRRGVTDSAAFLAFARNPDLWHGLSFDFPVPRNSLEGFLFPDTYEFAPHSSPEEVADEMLLNFSRRFARPKLREIQAVGRDIRDVVTLASLVEREAKTAEDRPRIAGVIMNRLKLGMKLDIDAGLEYVLPEHKSRLYYKDLQVDSPYNTYMHSGLPPGPIANPGLGSLDAAVEPEANSYLFYVAGANGRHVFSRTLAEHQAAVKRLRRAKRRTTGQTAGQGETPSLEIGVQ